MCQTTGDCTVTLCCDFQDPVELIPRFVHEWENGHKIVSGIKTSSKENPFIYFLRTIYYKLIKNMSETEMIEHFTGFGLYDKTFIDILRELDDPVPFIRGIVAEYGHGFNRLEVEYEQAKRRAGKTHNNFYTLYDAAMLSFTSYTKVGLRLATFLGFGTKVIEVTPSKLGDIEIMLPTIEAQERIVAILDRFDSLCNDIAVGLPAEIEARQKQYEYYRDKLLSFE